MLFKYLSQEEARELSKAGVSVFNRYKNSDRNSPWDRDWSDWKSIECWDDDDWLFLKAWDDEFRVEVE